MLPDMADVYAACGVDILEVGFPASNPAFDGELVRSSMTRSLENGTSVAVWRTGLAEIRARLPHAYVVAMGYRDLVPLVACRRGRWLADAVLKVGGAPPATGANLHRVAFVSTALEAGEVSTAREAGTAYVMLQANDGMTGLRRQLPPVNEARIAHLKEAGVSAPILLGIGISTPGHASEAVAYGADGVVVGSACIDAALKGRRALRSFLQSVRSALDD